MDLPRVEEPEEAGADAAFALVEWCLDRGLKDQPVDFDDVQQVYQQSEHMLHTAAFPAAHGQLKPPLPLAKGAMNRTWLGADHNMASLPPLDPLIDLMFEATGRQVPHSQAPNFQSALGRAWLALEKVGKVYVPPYDDTFEPLLVVGPERFDRDFALPLHARGGRWWAFRRIRRSSGNKIVLCAVADR